MSAQLKVMKVSELEKYSKAEKHLQRSAEPAKGISLLRESIGGNCLPKGVTGGKSIL